MGLRVVIVCGNDDEDESEDDHSNDDESETDMYGRVCEEEEGDDDDDDDEREAEAGLVRGERAKHARGRVARTELAGESGAGERLVDVERVRRSDGEERRGIVRARGRRDGYARDRGRRQGWISVPTTSESSSRATAGELAQSTVERSVFVAASEERLARAAGFV